MISSLCKVSQTTSTFHTKPLYVLYRGARNETIVNENNNMKINIIASNQTELIKRSGVILFFSYETPVAVFVPLKGGFETSVKYSNTTTKHIKETKKRWGCDFTVSDEEINNQIK